MNMNLWEYQADVVEVVDGDTLDLRIDLGFGVMLTGDEARVRLQGINTAEVFGVSEGSDEYQAGQAHKMFVEEWVAAAPPRELPFLIRTEKDDKRGKYGRWLADIYRRDNGASLTEALISEFGDAVQA